MMANSTDSGPAPAFQASSGNLLERMIFNYRIVICTVCALITAVLGYDALHLRMNANFDGMMPKSHPFIRNFVAHKDILRGLGNSVRIAVANPRGDIYDPVYLKALQEINDAVYLIPGVDRSAMKSLWTPAVRWTQVTEEGFRGGPVMPGTYDGSPAALAQLRQNVNLAGIAGNIVANDMRSSMIVVPLNEINAETGKGINYEEVARQLEQVRIRHAGTVDLHITGFAKLAGDLIDGLAQVMIFFAMSAAVAAILIYWFNRCLRSTLLVLMCSMIAVIWQLGMIHRLGFSLDPYSILVPFLVFAIGVSHGAQKMNGIMQDVGTLFGGYSSPALPP
jgi:predicted RND superfamily exporter protein